MPSLDLGSVVGPQGEQGATGAQGIRGEQGLPGPNQVTNSTATPLTGLLTGNGSVVGVASIDEAPTANSTGFARSGGADKAIKGRVPVYGFGKNLLRNPLFMGIGGLPVNQRGLSSYSSGYTIDGWKIVTGATVSLSASGVTYTRTAAGNAFAQFLKPDTVAGRTVCASLLLGSGTMVRAAALIPSTPVAYTNYIDKTEENVSLTCYLNSSGFFVFQISTTDDKPPSWRIAENRPFATTKELPKLPCGFSTKSPTTSMSFTAARLLPQTRLTPTRTRLFLRIRRTRICWIIGYSAAVEQVKACSPSISEGRHRIRQVFIALTDGCLAVVRHSILVGLSRHPQFRNILNQVELSRIKCTP